MIDYLRKNYKKIMMSSIFWLVLSFLPAAIYLIFGEPLMHFLYNPVIVIPFEMCFLFYLFCVHVGNGYFLKSFIIAVIVNIISSAQYSFFVAKNAMNYLGTDSLQYMYDYIYEPSIDVGGKILELEFKAIIVELITATVLGLVFRLIIPKKYIMSSPSCRTDGVNNV